MTIVLNGEEHQAGPDLTVLGLLESLGVVPARVAVEVNGDVLRRADFGRKTMQNGDRIELVQFVGGG